MLYGNDFSPSQIESWYADEKEAYADLGAGNASEYRYLYHELNRVHGFNFLPDRTFRRALGFGSAYGYEFEPIANRIEALTIVDPSDAFVREEAFGIPVRYVRPTVEGTLPFQDGQFDLITCLGVLHHIPNVGHVLQELYRCLEPGGYALIREPIVSMGDWRLPRPGLTKHERGIPLPLFRSMVQEAGFTLNRERSCFFSPIPMLWSRFGGNAFTDRLATRLDAFVCRLLAFNYRYHTTSTLGKFRPQSVFFVLTRDRARTNST